jgi:hypothetical protein
MRRRWGAVVLLAASAVLVGACGAGSGGDGGTASPTKGASGDVEALRPKASTVTDQLIANDWPAVHAQFDETMAKAVAEDGLANGWNDVVKRNGAYKSRGEPTQQTTGSADDVIVFDTPLQFERGTVKTRVALRPDGRIAGLFLLPSDDGAGGLGVDDLRPRASAVTDQLIAHDWGAVRAQFDDNMRSKLSEEALADAWNGVVKQKGDYRSRGDATQKASPAGQDILVFDTPLEFAKGAMKSRVAFHTDGTIAGLFILTPEA